ncbi:mtDNA inheritance, partitioning of the mitochondrial organelle [Dispira parvispora]|uniref:MtDNA inheritance, partitioning of the mitochondrial organelle n=1 Tax=Dispira parvispora TaxID=1520584 RepID=A0A9W8B0N0_9FUNG|nr:mtDNA inheritance, partitioning of the mitochondrial organelle [Dispira parvispora]
MGEIITLQFGEYANYVGTHWWNIQQAYPEESDKPSITSSVPAATASSSALPQPIRPATIDHSTLYRTGPLHNYSSVWTPRLLLYDLKENLGSLSPFTGLVTRNSLSGVPSHDPATTASASWNTAPKVYQQTPVKPSPFAQALERVGRTSDAGPGDPILPQLGPGIRCWSDFSENYWHPQSFARDFSTIAVNGSVNNFGDFQQGTELFRYQVSQDEWNESGLRYFVEEADHLQGFQFLADTTDGFGGYSTAYLAYLREEFPKEPVVVFGVADRLIPGTHSTTTTSHERQRLNEIISLAQFAQEEALYLPLQIPPELLRSTLKPSCLSETNSLSPAYQRYLTGALLAAAIDTFTLPYRTTSPIPNLPFGYYLNQVSNQRNHLIVPMYSTFPSTVPSLPPTSEILSQLQQSQWKQHPFSLQDISLFSNGLGSRAPIAPPTVVHRANNLPSAYCEVGETRGIDIAASLPVSRSFPRELCPQSPSMSSALVVTQAQAHQATWFTDSAHWLRRYSRSLPSVLYEQDEIGEVVELLLTKARDYSE